MKPLLISMLGVVVWFWSSAVFATSLEGIWEGNIYTETEIHPIWLEIHHQAPYLDIVVSLPQQGIKNQQAEQVCLSQSQLAFRVRYPSKLPLFLEFSFDTLKLAGYLLDNEALVGSLLLYKQSPTTAAEAPDFREEEITFRNRNTHFSGTLTLPKGKGKFPALVLINGSGTQTRDSEAWGFKPFKILAEHLAAAGVAVLRYDDRNVGKSKGGIHWQMTIEDFGEDVRQAVAYLQQRPEINPSQVGLYGFSEGAAVASWVARNNSEIAFLVLAGATAMPGAAVILAQSRAIMEAEGYTDQDIEEALQHTQASFEAASQNKGWKQLEVLLWQSFADAFGQLSAAEQQHYGSSQTYADAHTKAQLQYLRSPWYRYFIKYNPAEALGQVRCPVLLLYGENDLQTIPQEQLPKALEALHQQARNHDVSVRIFDKANHLFLHSLTGSPGEYPHLHKRFCEGFLETVTEWLQKRSTALY
ncbi:alpha/beta hydrolase family protein [Eisenibacter elegans]|uniref:alpha/beta hydrolase family protein n=1 Tax=Eisenibacter elegans TaxID=997 RepID=UPI00041FAEAF|nr:alpha/beta fold hydrolase [Eisenibacter elegans]